MKPCFAMVSVSTPYRGVDTLTPLSLSLCNQAVNYCQRSKLSASDSLTPSAIKVRALKRMAELVDEGQARGEIATRETFHGNQWNVTPQDTPPATLTDLGITRQRLCEPAEAGQS